MDDETWDRMVIEAMNAISPKVEAKLDHDLVRAYRAFFWEIYKMMGADTMDYRSCPPPGVLIPDVPTLALDEVRELKARFDRLEQFAIWVFDSGHYGYQREEYPGQRHNEMVDAA